MYSTNLIRALQNRINDATTSEEVFELSEIIRKLNVGNVKVVSTYVNLLNIFVATGSLYFVEDEEALYYGINGIWHKITEQFSAFASAWGQGTSGRLGDNFAIARSSPVSVVGGFSDWIQVSSGSSQTAALRGNGTIWMWGQGNVGQLGNNAITDRSSPVAVVGGFTDWIQVSAGASHNLALRANGTAWAWGSNSNGRLGDGTATNRSSPVSVIGGFTDWIQVSAGFFHSLGLRANGTIWSWGYNTQGQIGDDTTVSKSSPVAVVGGFTDWIQINAGYRHSVALRANGTIWSWGNATNGALGDGTVNGKSSPVAIVGGFSDWVEIAKGPGFHSLAIRANGTAWAWGSNNYLQLGDGTATNRSSPVSVIGGFTDWIQVSAGRGHNLGIRTNGTAWAWGRNTNGHLGDGTTVSKSSPVAVVGGFTDWMQISAGFDSSIALRDN